MSFAPPKTTPTTYTRRTTTSNPTSPRTLGPIPTSPSTGNSTSTSTSLAPSSSTATPAPTSTRAHIGSSATKATSPPKPPAPTLPAKSSSRSRTTSNPSTSSTNQLGASSTVKSVDVSASSPSVRTGGAPSQTLRTGGASSQTLRAGEASSQTLRTGGASSRTLRTGNAASSLSTGKDGSEKRKEKPGEPNRTRESRDPERRRDRSRERTRTEERGERMRTTSVGSSSQEHGSSVGHGSSVSHGSSKEGKTGKESLALSTVASTPNKTSRTPARTPSSSTPSRSSPMSGATPSEKAMGTKSPAFPSSGSGPPPPLTTSSPTPTSTNANAKGRSISSPSVPSSASFSAASPPTSSTLIAAMPRSAHTTKTTTTNTPPISNMINTNITRNPSLPSVFPSSSPSSPPSASTSSMPGTPAIRKKPSLSSPSPPTPLVPSTVQSGHRSAGSIGSSTILNSFNPPQATLPTRAASVSTSTVAGRGMVGTRPAPLSVPNTPLNVKRPTTSPLPSPIPSSSGYGSAGMSPSYPSSSLSPSYGSPSAFSSARAHGHSPSQTHFSSPQHTEMQGLPHSPQMLSPDSPHSPPPPSPMAISLAESRAIMKRLLAKPAPYLSASGSESEGGLGLVGFRSRSRAGRGGGMSSGGEKGFSSGPELSVARKCREPDTDMDTDAQLEVLDDHIASLGLVGAISFGGGVGSDSDAPPSTSMSLGGERKRNVLRRKPSGPKPNPAIVTTGSSPPSQTYIPSAGRSKPTPTVALPISPTRRSMTMPPTSPHSSIHASYVPLSPTTAARTPIYAKLSSTTSPISPSHPSLTSLRPSTSQGLGVSSKRSSRSNPSSRGSSPGGSARKALTPASALVEAYKRQEQEQEEAKRASRMFEAKLAASLIVAEEEKGRLEREERERGVELKKRAEEWEREREEKKRQEEADSLLRASSSTTGTGIEDMVNRLGVGKKTHVYAESSLTASSSALSLTLTPSRAGSRTDMLSGGGKGFEVIEKMLGSPLGEQQHSRSFATASNHSSSPATSSPATSSTHLPPSTSRKVKRKPPPVDQELNTEPPGENENPATPYYTVFGATSGRVVAVGGPEDSWGDYGAGWDAGVWRTTSATVLAASVSEKGEKDKGVMKSLSRKVSGHWKRGAGGSVSAGEEERGRQSLQEKRLARKGSKRGLSGSVGKDKEKSRERDAFSHTRRGSLRLSIDRFGSRERELDAGLMRLGGSELGHGTSPSTMSTPRRGAGVPVIPSTLPYAYVDAEETGGAGSVSKLTKPRKSEPPSNAGGGGGKLWKLMKRISTGGLREKFQQDDTPPPVPALPKEYEAFNSSRSNDGHSNVGSGNSHSKSISPPFDSPQHFNSQVPKENGMLPGSPASATQSPVQRGVLSRFMPSRASISISGTSASMPPSRKLSAGNPRPSTTTRSSSPVYSSSDVASSRFFNRAHSTRSSSSSYGEEVPPPMPKPPMAVGQHIIPPNELQKLASGDQRSPVSASSPRSSSNPNSPLESRKQVSLGPLQLPPFERKEEDWMIVTSPSAELPSLPFPPRRTNTIPAVLSSEEEMDRSESPTIPSFSTAGAINAFPSRRSLSSKASSPVSPPSSTVSSPAPPRPSRSAQRPSPLTSPQSTRLPSPEAVRTPQQFDAGRKSESYNPNRRSSGGFSTSTARPWRRSSSFGANPTQAISPSRPSTASASTSSRAILKFRAVGSREEKKQMLTEKEKADKWDDLLERSARAGGTLHLGGGTEELASDQISMRMSVASSAS